MTAHMLKVLRAMLPVLLVCACTYGEGFSPRAKRLDDVALSAAGRHAVLSWCTVTVVGPVCSLVLYEFSTDRLTLLASPRGDRHLHLASFHRNDQAVLAVESCYRHCAGPEGTMMRIVSIDLETRAETVLVERSGFIRYPVENPHDGSLAYVLDPDVEVLANGYVGPAISSSGRKIIVVGPTGQQSVHPSYMPSDDEKNAAGRRGRSWYTGFDLTQRPSFDVAGNLIFSSMKPPYYLQQEIKRERRISTFFPMKIPKDSEKAEIHPIFGLISGDCYSLTATRDGQTYFVSMGFDRSRSAGYEVLVYKDGKVTPVTNLNTYVTTMHVSWSGRTLALLADPKRTLSVDLYSVDIGTGAVKDHRIRHRLQDLAP